MSYQNMEALTETLRALRVIPVAALEDEKTVLPAAKALCDGGLPAIEVTFRTPIAAKAVAAIKKTFPQMLVAAGTILTAEQAESAADAGADFLVSPGLDEPVLDAAQKRGIVMIPGICTPTEAQKALSRRITTVKFFPAEAAGGLPMLKAMSAPYPMLSFMPTGGISPENLQAYLSFPKVAACGGSFMLSKALLQAEDYEQIYRLSRKAAELAAQAKGR